jgi:hypothetical protein
MSSASEPTLPKDIQQSATIIAMVVRKAMAEFNSEHLSQEQLRKLNPIIADAIATALHAFQHFENFEKAQQFVAFHFQNVPADTPQPSLLDYYVQFWNDDGELST